MKSREIWIDYLRSFITILVVAFHAALAYTTFGYFKKEAYILSTHPIIDIQRWIGMDIFVFFNDIFFMSLMFLISGLFVFQSIQKKGSGSFLQDRFYRLFIPFVVGVTFLMLMAYYPSYHIAHADNSLKDYVVDYFTVEGWPVGPPWFIWVLFLFNIIIALIFPLIKGQLIRLSERLSKLKNKPYILLLIWVLITWIIYVPLRMIYGAYTWAGFGPFDFQKSRLLLYFGYFILGVTIGSISNDKCLFTIDSKFINNWKIWIGLAILAFLSLLIIGELIKHISHNKYLNSIQIQLIYCTIYVTSCVLSCFAFLSTFKIVADKSNVLFDSFVPNAFSIYLIHYILIIWCQFALLEINIPVILKFAITFLIVLSLGWIISYFIRKNRIINKFL